MFKRFFDKEEALIKASGYITALGALFLNIPIPKSDEAISLLANIQVFWLLLITSCLVVLFFRFVKYLLGVERGVQKKYGVPMVGIFSFTVGIILIWVVTSMWGYIMVLYNDSFTQFLEMAFPGVALMGAALLELFIEKQKSRFTLFSKIVIDSFVMAVLLSIAGIYIQQVVLKYFYYYWLFPVLPCLFVLLFIVSIVLSKLKRRKLFSYA